MIRDFLKNSAIYGVGRVFAVIAGIITLPIITHALSPEDYAVIDLLNMILVLLNVTVALEITQAVPRFMIDSANIDDKRLYVSTAYYFSLLMYLIISILIFFFKDFLAVLIFRDISYNAFFLYLIPWLFLQGINTFISNQFRWENLAFFQIISQVVSAFSTLFFVIIFINILKPSIQNLLIAYISAQITTTIVSLLLLKKTNTLILEFSWKHLRKMLQFSMPLVFSSLFFFFQNYTDRIILNKILGLHDVGLYAVGVRVSSLLAVFASIFQMSILPLIYKNYKDISSQNDIGIIVNLFLFMMLLFILFFSLFMPEIFRTLIGVKFIDAIKIIPILFFSILFQTLYVFSPGLGLEKKTVHIASLSLFGLVLSVVMNYTLINYYGLIGAAFASLVVSIIFCTLNTVFNQKYYKVLYKYSSILYSMIVVTLVIIGFYFMLPIELSVTSMVLRLIVFLLVSIFLLNILIDSKTKQQLLEIAESIKEKLIK